MKKTLTYLIILAGLISGCKKEDDPILGDPDKRLAEVLGNIQKDLLSSPGGWKANVFTGANNGYSFYMQFTDKGRVTMTSDIDTVSAITPKESSYRLKALQRPTLIFDTYNYLHLLADPDPSKLGGTVGIGLISEYEFAWVETKGDSMKVKGTFYDMPVTFVKATAAEQQLYAAGRIKTIMKLTSKYATDSKFLFVQLADNRKITIGVDSKTKRLTFSYVDDQQIVVTQSVGFSFTLKGIQLAQPYGNATESFSELLWDDVKGIYYVMVGTKRYEFQASTTPIIPLELTLGSGKANTILIYNPLTVPVNLNADFNTRYNAAKTGLAAVGNAGRVLDYVQVMFNPANETVIRFYYRNTAGTAFQANFLYTMAKAANGDITFTFVSRDNNANVVGAGFVSITDYFTNNTFKMDWVSNPSSDLLLGGLYNKANPASYYYGTLSK
ncbi:DUF4302 domain-containing protein [Chitinophaga sp. SYP-B3965]|uniref:DUF4302 domain-containing protein n=1 Tax=Chitinophaga sp. SYP-B3965 TaxID=2663120 RepID=UPI001299DA3C|nr:DUF4302 domain-containing protein [Chitinophaga sp. SYP-B3965]MRG49122.1 DUF4302 domain-containing protein [Chitinophaga sp. SYP-B3965]